MWPGPRPTSVPSCILIHPDVWPQETWSKIWGCAPLEEGGGFPFNTIWRRTMPTSVTNFNFVWLQQAPIHGPRIIRTHSKLAPVNFECGGCFAPFRGGAISPSNTVAGAEDYQHAKFHLDPSNCLATIHQRYRQDRTDTAPIG